jgi:hypothetical protein
VIDQLDATSVLNPENKHCTVQTEGWAGLAVGLEVLKGHEILTFSNAPTTGSGAYTAIYSGGTGGFFPGSKAAGHGHGHDYLWTVTVNNTSWCICIPPYFFKAWNIYRTIILLVVLYGCETWSLTIREKRRLMVFENRVLRRVFGPKRDEATGEWRKLHIEELNYLYSLPNIVRVVKSRRMRWAGHVARMGEERGVHRVLVGKPEGKRPLGRPRRRWEDNIKMDLQKVGGGCGDCMELAQDRDRWRALVSTVKNLRVP